MDFDRQVEVLDVGFYLADDDASFHFTSDTSITLTAPKSGPMAGILFWEARSASQGRKHMIQSNNAETLVGTFYLPRGTLVVNASVPVAAESAFTAIVADKLEMLEKPNLVLNSDYTATDIPVPEGIGGGIKEVRLTR